jgi:hypothetical protein
LNRLYSLIHLLRKNILKHCIDIIGNRERGKKFQIRIEDVNYYINEITWRNKDLEDWFSNLHYIQYYYEDMVGKENIEFLNIVDFKKFLKCNNIPDLIPVYTKKNNSDFIEDNLLNYDEFYTYFINTKYSNMLINHNEES